MLNLENQILIFESYLVINRKKNANDNIKKNSLVATALAAPTRFERFFPGEITNLYVFLINKYAYQNFEMTTKLCIVDSL